MLTVLNDSDDLDNQIFYQALGTNLMPNILVRVTSSTMPIHENQEFLDFESFKSAMKHWAPLPGRSPGLPKSLTGKSESHTHGEVTGTIPGIFFAGIV